MIYSAMTVSQRERPRDNNHQYVKMGLKKGKYAMNQEGNGQNDSIGLNNEALLYDLLKRSREGDTEAMEGIYERYKQPLFNLIYRHTYNLAVAEDLLQDIFLKIFTHLKDLQKKESFVGWLYRIAINTCYSYMRTKRSYLQKTIPLNEVEGKIEKAYDSPDKTLQKSLDDAIQSLSHKLKNIFLLHDVQGFKHKEISQMLGCSVGTSKSQLFKARMKIRNYFENKHNLKGEKNEMLSDKKIN